MRDGIIAATCLAIFALATRAIGPDFLTIAWVATGLSLIAAIALRRKLAKLLALGVCAFVIMPALFESGLSLSEKFQETARFGNHYADYYDSPEPQLGYRALPSRSVHATKHSADGSEIYAVDYTIGEHQTRITPGNEEGSKTGTVIFLGGSFAFGEGLEDDETLPSRFSRATGFRYRVVNYSLHGYGPHHAVRTLELGLPDVQVVGEVVAVVYVLIPSHPERAAGEARWDPQGPAYTLAPDGSAQHQGPFSNPERVLAQSLRRSRLWERLRGLWALPDDEKIALTLALLGSLREIAHERYSAPFFVVYWDEPGERSQRLLGALDDADLTVLRASKAIPADAIADSRIPGDGHPTALANQYVGSALARMIGPALGRIEPAPAGVPARVDETR